MAFLKDTAKASLLDIRKLKIELKNYQDETSRNNRKNIKIQEYKEKNNKQLQEKEQKLKEWEAELKAKEKELPALLDLLNQQNEKIKELHKFKSYFDALTTKPKKDLTSFQFQIYQMLPVDEDTLENHYTFITEIGFSELSGENFEHILYNLEKKGYFQSYTCEDVIFWKKIEK